MVFSSLVKRLFPLFLLLCSFGFASFESREVVLQRAAEQNLPVVAVFLGDESCLWSQRVKEELLESSAVIEQVGQEALFLQKLGKEALIWQIMWNQEEEREHYKVNQVPLFVLLDPQGREFARLDYLASQPDRFAKTVLSLIQDFHEICSAVDQGFGKQNEKALQALYLKAQRLSAPSFKQVILSQGLKKEKETFFHLEKYQLLLEKCKLKHPEVLKLRKELISRDPNNGWGTERQLALLEFKKKASTLKKNGNPEKALTPLIHYLDQFGSRDEENKWKIEMTMAEFLFSKQLFPQAVIAAQQAYEHAPNKLKPRISKALAIMKTKCSVAGISDF